LKPPQGTLGARKPKLTAGMILVELQGESVVGRPA
jgi:hypothetical protein